jgi:hypothetical protein
MPDFNEYYGKLELLQRNIYNDLRNASIEAHANFLVAMGAFNYIEILGGFYYFESERGICKKRFNFVFNNLLSTSYKNFFNRIKKIDEPYSILRCGMTHEYLAKTYVRNNNNIEIDYKIRGSNTEEDFNRKINKKACGVEFSRLSRDRYQINIENPRLITDLNLAFDEFKNKINSITLYKNRFLKRANEIRLERLE